MKVRKYQFIPAGLDGILLEILSHLKLAGFAGVAQLANFPLDRYLITALVERWKPETHTFHMPLGECTIMLQDIAIQIGLRVDELLIFAATGAMHNQNELQLTRFARAYIMRLIGGFMLVDYSSSRVTVRYLPLLEDFAITRQYS
ncbi:serine/threonine-protein phosphatase 7 long form homolog [Abrus precatorius]|uniref:Serine/threonine-protein phosphatase 7 long form homolog n=1 Tax=Abrus precatorius TaxID=3816 RepID=A0A8B8JZV9_ABRPR|nr:serine/threonine-protein phosphatase 7 long form homolog [Abrus precatorius]